MQENASQYKPVTIIVPMRNEEKYILSFLESLARTTHPRRLLEVLIIDGRSNDQSVEIVRTFKLAHPDLDIKLIDNHKITIPNALNLGIENSKNELIVRMDCHTEYHKNYISNSIKNLYILPNAVGTGGVITPKGKSETGKAIAKALTSKLGNGGARYRSISATAETDTIWCGCWRRRDAISIGLFDVSKEANEDFEFNQRLRKIGAIYTCTDIKADQFVRENLTALYQQYKRYGFWKARVIKTSKENFQARQIIPFVFLSALSLSAFITWISIIPVALLLTIYLTAVFFEALRLNPRSICEYFKIAISFTIIHSAWYIGIITGLILFKNKWLV